MSPLILISVLVAIVGAVFAFTGLRRLFQRRYLRAAGLEITGVLFLLLASSAFLLASNLYTYQRLTFEQAVAEISFQRLSAQNYRVEIKALDSHFQQTVELRGDEWQLDAQVLSWQGLATLAGLDAHYRLHRISGRYIDIKQEQQEPHSAFSLVKNPAYIDDDRFDLWPLARRYQQYLGWVDAAYGSAVFLPMTDGAKYRVSISRSGLIARPANAIARQAVSQWIGL